MKKIALTGGIGTGKTFISRQFIASGIPVFYADDEAKKLYEDADVLSEIRLAFGNEVFEGNVLDFKKLSAIVFNNELKKSELEGIIHPKVMQKFDAWCNMQGAETVMMESAIIFESHLERYFDQVIVVNASEATRIRRISQRNPELSENEIIARINSQMSQELKCSLADEVIEHDDDI